MSVSTLAVATTTQLGLMILPTQVIVLYVSKRSKNIVGPTTSALKVRPPSGLHVCAPFLSCTVRVAQMPRSWAPVPGCPCSMMGRQVLAVVSIPSPCPGTMMGGLGVCLYRCLWLLCHSCTAILSHEQQIPSPVLPMLEQPHSRIIARRVHLCALIGKHLSGK